MVITSDFMKIFTLIILLIFLFLLIGCISTDESTKISFEETQLNKDCLFDKYNCDDFATQKEAQQMFEKCDYDAHRLDRDKDEKACEK